MDTVKDDYHKWVVLLRAVNVGGRNIIKMEMLRTALEKEGFKDVKTYIQSGNIILESTIQGAELLETEVERFILNTFKLKVSCIARKYAVYKKTIEKNPFKENIIKAQEKLYVGFLKHSPEPKDIETLESMSNEDETFKVLEKQVYVLCIKDGRKLQFSNSLLEKKLHTKATARNWATVNKIASF